MDNSVINISKTLLDLAGVSETVLYTTPKGRAALNEPKLESAQRSLLERIDGFRSVEQLLAMSGDLIGVHAALGKLMAAGCVSTNDRAVAEVPAPVVVPVKPPVVAPIRTPAAPSAASPVARGKVPAPAMVPAATPPPAKIPAAVALAAMELDNAKRVLSQEARLVFGDKAAKLQPRIDGCRSIEEIYDLIVKFQQHLASTGKANPDVFLDRLTKGIASARKQAPAAKQAPAR